MRRHVTSILASLALAFTLVPPAGAEPAGSASAESGEGAGASGKRRPCTVGVVGFDVQRHVRTYSIADGQVTRDQLSSNALGVDVIAWGYYDSEGRTSRTLRLNAITADGRPRNVAIDQSRTKLAFARTARYDQGSFTPRLFADGYTFYAYTVDGNTLRRWTLTRFSNGSRRFTRPVKVASGFGDWTSLQAGGVARVRGRESEVLYGTTATGQLRQVVVPIERPGRAKVKGLAASGYEGVSEMSWGKCGKGLSHDVLVAISPGTNSATWTVIKKPLSKPRAKLRGAVTGGPDWNFSASF